MKSFWYALLCFIPLVAAADNDVSKVNSSIRIEAGQVVGDVESVNGSIHIEDGATTEDVETVNGSITIGDRAQVEQLNTVNGGIRIGEQTRARGIETVNGSPEGRCRRADLGRYFRRQRLHLTRQRRDPGRPA